MKAQKGFSLIEVLIVVLIISIITAICMPGYVRFVQKSHLAKIMLPALRVLEQNVAVYHVLHKKMPGEPELSIIADKGGYQNMQVSLESGEIKIMVMAPGLTDKLHFFDGQEITATPDLRDDQITGFKVGGELAKVLGLN